MASSGAKGVFMDAKAKMSKEEAGVRKREVTNYFHELKEELKKVSWTTQAELRLCTKIVVGAIFVFGIGIYVMDLAIKGMLVAFGNLFHLIFG